MNKAAATMVLIGALLVVVTSSCGTTLSPSTASDAARFRLGSTQKQEVVAALGFPSVRTIESGYEYWEYVGPERVGLVVPILLPGGSVAMRSFSVHSKAPDSLLYVFDEQGVLVWAPESP